MTNPAPSCVFQNPRDSENATANAPATGNATYAIATSRKPSSIQELREQLRAQQERNRHEIRSPEINDQLRSELRSIVAWLRRIGEDDPAVINATLDKCCADSDCLDYFRNRALENPQPEEEHDK